MDVIEKKNLSQRLEPAPSVLYLVGTPIGHLGDLSPRAISILKNVSAIACEDTRRSGQMLKTFGVSSKLLSFYEHNTESRIPQLLELLSTGKSLALISDAGLPSISDPGEKLVTASRINGYEVICIPGPCAATTALISSGFPSNKFCFEGFLPAKGKEREKLLKSISQEPRTTVIYEAPHRLIQLLNELEKLCGKDRPLHVARELTKRHEQHLGSTIGAVRDHFLSKKPLGEFTIVLGGAPNEDKVLPTKSQLIKEMKALIKNGSSASEAARKVAHKSDQTKRFLYSLLHEIDLKKQD